MSLDLLRDPRLFEMVLREQRAKPKRKIFRLLRWGAVLGMLAIALWIFTGFVGWNPFTREPEKPQIASSDVLVSPPENGLHGLVLIRSRWKPEDLEVIHAYISAEADFFEAQFEKNPGGRRPLPYTHTDPILSVREQQVVKRESTPSRGMPFWVLLYRRYWPQAVDLIDENNARLSFCLEREFWGEGWLATLVKVEGDWRLADQAFVGPEIARECQLPP